MPKIPLLAAVAVAGLCSLCSSRAVADEAESIASVIGYTVPVGVSVITIAVNGTHAAFDEGAPRAWRILGYGSGAVSVALGTYLLIDQNETGRDIAVGVVPLATGVAALVTALLAPIPTDIVGSAQLGPWTLPNGVGLILNAGF
ncbi:MAG: hypothetical protein HY698_21585 [Deltaproteobacteria bacterium]|nr:hypothetical protein [Deltaproteobacteria bacterium]